MSKSLKKLIDINRLREFKNKLVGTDSAYVQTGAVDQTVAGTKTFSKPIVGSVTGSSGSCTGNAATATTATTAKACTGNAATANIATKATQDAAGNTITTTYATKAENNTKANNSEVVHKSGDETIAGTKTFSNGVLSTAVNAFMAQNNGYTVLLRNDGSSTYLLISDKDGVPGTWSDARPFVISNSTGVCSINGNASTATNATNANHAKSADTATKLATARTINGTAFNGTANITTANWGTARNISITDGTNTSTAVSVNGSANVSLNLPATIKANLTGNCSGSSGSCTGNAATATNATYTNWLRTSSHSDHLFHTEWDKAGYFWTYVTAGNGDYRAVRVARSDSAATANACTGNAATATKLATARTIALSGAATGTATAFDGSGNITIPVTSLDASKLTGTASVSTTGNAATATTATTAKACTGNAASATKLQTARTINGTAFNGTANITTANWGTARNISITDGTNTSTAVSVNGSANVSLNLPSTIKATFVGNVTGNVTGNCSGSSGSCTGNAATATTATTAQACTGNAATATKLAAKRTIALSGAATGTATSFDGSGNITIPVTALAASAIRAQWYAAYPDGAEAHNAMWGGRDITAAFNNGTVSANIANGTFRDIFPGDYITKAVTIYGNGTPGMTYTVNWVIADCDYWINKGDQNNGMETHHVVIVPQQPIFNANMNATNTTEGGYKGSVMYRSIIRASVTGGIVSAFGSDHILTFRDGITNSVDTSHVSSGIPQWTGTPGWWGEWVSVQCNLMSEKMVYGAPICAAGAMDNSVATRQMSAFRLSEKLINYNRHWWWLRDVVSSADFALAGGDGSAYARGASFARGVRPFALLR